ncbi:MAG: hypothetical protein EOO38_04390 [Cytophagaceae bacterium]|nr:MAG: hypothetical protein EOO38_04390 [Cytophagaceae bacterium]
MTLYPDSGCETAAATPTHDQANQDQADTYPRPGTGKKKNDRKLDTAKSKRKHSRRIVKMAKLGENYCRLSQATKKQLKQVWRGKLEPEQLWWCITCHCVFRAADIRLYDEPGGEIFTVCPHCNSCTFYWWHGWPSLVLEGWTHRPELGRRFHFPHDWLEETVEEPGILCRLPSPTDAPQPSPDTA